MSFVPTEPVNAPVALVTGAARRLGRAIALALADAGYDIAIHYGRSAAEAEATAAEVRQRGRRAACMQADLGALDDAGAMRLIEQCAAQLGPPTCLVNNASIFEADTIDTFGAAALQRHMAVNLVAPLHLAQALHQGLLPSARAVVINLLDQKLANPNPDYLSYTLSKAALQQATVLLAQALAPTVRVVGVAPGITLPSGGQSDAGFARAHGKTPLGRSSTPADIGQAVVYLAAADAVTGTTLLVDGGQHLVPSARDVMFLTE